MRTCIYGGVMLSLSRKKQVARFSYHFQMHFVSIKPHEHWVMVRTYGDNSYQATTHIRRQLISGDNSYQFEKATTHTKRQLISIKTHIRKLKSV